MHTSSLPRRLLWLRPVVLLAVLLTAASACASPRSEASPASATAHVEPAAAAAPPAVEAAIAAVRSDYAPDRRVARFDVQALTAGGAIILRGETTSAAARTTLAAALAAQGIAYRDEVVVLPDASIGQEPWALASNSVSNLRTTPGHASELSTQVLLGTPLRVLKQQEGFYFVQTPEGYLSWVDGGGIRRITEAELQAYRSAPRIIYLRAAGTAYSAPDTGAEPVIDLVLGAQLQVDGAQNSSGRFIRARTPDGRIAYVPAAEAAPYDQWLANVRATESSLVATARTMIGAPYLWGGTSTKGMDCSGFTKTIYLMNGLLLPRDASQQVHIGTLIDESGDFSRLRPGDLLFFGRAAAAGAPERVTHVGMWIGDGRFIHSAGRVRINSVDPAQSDYDASNHSRYLRSKRVLGSSNGVKLLTDDALFRF
jgi:gamma-D-glutamyl-L-lysine dipeptidyl-peptidase